MMQKNPRAVFEERTAYFSQEAAKVESKLTGIAWLRLLVFVVFLVVELLSWRWGGGWWLLILVIGLGAFVAVVKWSNAVEELKQFLELKKRLNEEEVQRLDGQLDHFDRGEEFLDVRHVYSGDMDLFGQHSLYQLLNRATSIYGKTALAKWLTSPADRVTIAARQNAVAGLASDLDWRQDFQATGLRSGKSGEGLDAVRSWLEQPAQLINSKLYQLLPFVLPPLLLAAAGLSLFGLLHWAFPLALTILHGTINRTLKNYSQQVFEETDRKTRFLKGFAALLERLENRESKSEWFSEAQASLKKTGKTAHEEIGRLAKILSALELRLNGLPYLIMNLIFFWDIIYISRLEKWKAAHKEDVLDWFETMGEVEAASSLAGLHYAHPEWNFPTISNKSFYLEGVGIGHPLIPGDVRVSNRIDLPDHGNIWLITGSNMSGKSTYLRTVGINVVLALTGAPVCAEELELSPLLLVSSMRTLDSLEENTSSFFAELKRLKLVIDLVGEGKPVFFLLDEILKGTNSRDRHAGARALIHQLQAKGGSGLVSTHDLELVDLSEELKNSVYNYSFNCDITPEGKLLFDYTLTDGVCRSMNATALMRNMGIEM